MSEELKPCPMCKSEAFAVRQHLGHDPAETNSINCLARLRGSNCPMPPIESKKSIEQAAIYWNTRQPARRNALLRESMQRWIDYHNERADKAESLLRECKEALEYWVSKEKPFPDSMTDIIVISHNNRWSQARQTLAKLKDY